MIIKLIKETKNTPSGSIIEADELTSKDLLANGIAIQYTTEIEQLDCKSLLAILKQNDLIDQEKVKTINIETKGKKMTENHIGKAFQMIYEGKSVTGMSEGTAGDGGNLIGTAIADVQGLALEGSKIWAKTKKITLPVNTNSVKVPVDKNEPWIYTVAGKPFGCQPGEGAQKTSTKLEFGVQTLTLGKTVFYIPVTEELLQDAGMLDGWIRQSAYSKLATTLDNSILSGAPSYSAVLGNATYTTSLAISGTPTSAQIYEAQAYIYPSLKPEWYMGPVDWQVAKSAFATAANLNGQLIDPIGMKLAGLPVNVMPMLSRFVLADFSQYTVAVPRINDILSISEHVRFEYDEVCYRLVHRSAGAPTFGLRTAGDGTTMGAFVNSIS
jgi:HK97 family phage major capsid protein